MKKLKRHNIDWAQIDRFLASADKKLASAHKILAFDEEACLQQTYEAMLKASLGFMFSHGSVSANEEGKQPTPAQGAAIEGSAKARTSSPLIKDEARVQTKDTCMPPVMLACQILLL
jgi:hypothetical protein